jgi:hypothetical protein
MFIHLDDQKLVGSKKKKKKGKKCALEQFSSPRVCFPRARFQAARFIFGHTATFRPGSVLSSHFSTTAAHRSNPTLFSSPLFLLPPPLSTTTVRRPKASLFSSP